MATTRLDVHVRKGLTDGLQISSVACTGDLWALIMDAGSGLGNQVYKLAPAQFLPKEWIMEQWDRGYYISAVAGAFLLQFPCLATYRRYSARLNQ